MKTFLSGVASVAILSVARAHNSWAPHTHTIDNRHSDLFLLAVAGMIAFITGAIALRVVAKRRHSRSTRARGQSR